MTERYTAPLVAVLGGGQLGRMLGLAGVPLGLGFRFLDPVDRPRPRSRSGRWSSARSTTSSRCSRRSRAPRSSPTSGKAFPPAAARMLEARGHTVHPSTQALEVSQDRLDEKTTVPASSASPWPSSPPSTSSRSCTPRSTEIGLPAVLKTRRGGYDGKGQAVLRDAADVDAGVRDARDGRPADPRGVRAVRPRALDRRGARRGRRGALLAARREPSTRAASCAPRARRRRALDRRRCSATAEALRPRAARRTSTTSACSRSSCSRSATRCSANEMAPRVHNSGHWTIEGAVTSQFENHLRAVLGWPLGATDARGRERDGQLHRRRCPTRPRCSRSRARTCTDYGKAPRPGRKVGHVTVTAADPDRRSRPSSARWTATLSRLSGPRTAHAMAPASRSLAISVRGEAPVGEHLVGVLTGPRRRARRSRRASG